MYTVEAYKKRFAAYSQVAAEVARPSAAVLANEPKPNSSSYVQKLPMQNESFGPASDPAGYSASNDDSERPRSKPRIDAIDADPTKTPKKAQTTAQINANYDANWNKMWEKTKEEVSFSFPPQQLFAQFFAHYLTFWFFFRPTFILNLISIAANGG